MWHERHLVERLLYTVVAARLLLVAEERRFIGWTLQELEELATSLHAAEPGRTAAIQAVAADWGLAPGQLTLARVAREAPEPWATIFDDHHRSLLELTRELEAAAEDNRRLAAARTRRRGRPTVGSLRSIPLGAAQRITLAEAAADEDLEQLAYEATLAVLEQAVPRSLVTTLG